MYENMQLLYAFVKKIRQCREAIPLACRFRQREVLPEGTRIAQVIYLQFLSLFGVYLRQPVMLKWKRYS